MASNFQQPQPSMMFLVFALLLLLTIAAADKIAYITDGSASAHVDPKCVVTKFNPKPDRALVQTYYNRIDGSGMQIAQTTMSLTISLTIKCRSGHSRHCQGVAKRSSSRFDLLSVFRARSCVSRSVSVVRFGLVSGRFVHAGCAHEHDARARVCVDWSRL